MPSSGSSSAISDAGSRADTQLLVVAAAVAPRGVVLLIPGLNNCPEVMAPFSALLGAAGYHSATLRLSGHSPGESWHGVSAQLWLDEYFAARRTIAERFPGLPFFVLGYSLGGALATAAIQRNPRSAPHAMYLLAPALHFTAWGTLRRLLCFCAPSGLALPSAAPSHLRARSSTALRAYAALFELATAATAPGGALQTTPGRILLLPGDELVNYRATLRWLDEQRLTNWQLSPLCRSLQLPHRHRHQLIDPGCFPPAAWTELSREILDFLAQNG